MKSANRKILKISLIIVITLNSCGYIQLRNNVKNLIDLKIELPDSMLQFISDSINMEVKEVCIKNPAIVYWIDSVDCSSCLMNSLYQLETVLEYGKNDSVIFDLAFVISPPKNETEYFKEVVKHKKLKTPILIDTANYIAEHNPTLAKQNMIRVFLLDKEHCIKAIGDPLNSKVWDLYKKVIEELN
ncbi:MAG: hypothetical protein J6V02_06435, partial [Bacteroidaceae bacterium]|nr:hypothetical protein [Bacteroidaceae bacterium]